jgi:high-affinity iron transporter
MLATLVIGLREGLEATLIVGIIAAFLRRNRIPLAPMWLGVGLAVALSIGVGVGLQVVEQALPQAQQEGMEAIIGVVAVVFVTGMIVWMRKHARNLQGELEASARSAMGRGTAWALAGMAFLAVLKEGFETAVFLLATFQAAQNTALAALGAVVGVVAAIGIGFGIYTGGVRLNLAKFFTGTGIFLVFVAAGLVLTVLRRAHEAGWIVVGQQRTVDLTWLAPNGSVQGALVTGVLGIPADPRVIEVLGWLLYLVPVLALSLWPRAWRPAPARIPRVRLVFAGGFAVVAILLAVAVPGGRARLQTDAPLRNGTAVAQVSGDQATLRVTRSGREARLAFPASAHRTTTHDGVAADRWTTTGSVSTADRPATMNIDDLATLFGRVPVGVSADVNPGPFTTTWHSTATSSLWTVGGGILDAKRTERTVLTVSGGGLNTPRTYTFDTTAWSVPSAVASSRAAELALWKAWLPVALGIAALAQLLLSLRDRRRLLAAPVAQPTPTVPAGDPARKTAYAVR